MFRRASSVLLARGAAAMAVGGATVSTLLMTNESSSQASNRLELKYFDGKGAVETSRLLMAFTNAPFTDTRWKMDMSKPYGQRCNGFMEAKARGDLAANLDRAPILLVDGVAIGESKAIERFLARRLGMMGSNEVEAALVDAWCEHVRDIKSGIQHAPDKVKFVTDTLPALLKRMEREATSEQAVVGNTRSLADVAMYELVEEFFPAREAYLLGKGESIGVSIDSATLLHGCPKLAAAVRAVKNHPGVAKHIRERNYSAPW